MEIVKVSSRHQIVIPKKARAAAGIEVGDELLVEEEGGRLLISRRPTSYAERSLGLGKDTWNGIDAQEYVNGERESWPNNSNSQNSEKSLRDTRESA